MKILIISSDTKSLVDFRGDLMKEMVDYGNTVVAVAPEIDQEEDLEKIGVLFRQLDFKRASLNPLNDFQLYRSLSKIIKDEKPDLIFSYAVKPVIYASLAGRKHNVVRIYSLLPGLGYLFNTYDRPSFLRKIINRVVKILLKRSFAVNQKVFVQNPDDKKELIESGIIEEDKCVRVNSSGINLEKFSPKPLPDDPVFIMISRLLKDKGVYEYFEAASKLKKKYSSVAFFLLGPTDSNPTAVKEHELKKLLEKGHVNYLGEVKDVRNFIEKSSIFILPSYYREGVPRSIQEAMAMGRPIITTDWIGCRETVIDGYNGFLVKPQSAYDLAEKMEYFIINPKKVGEMGANSIDYCRKKFDVKFINKQMLHDMKILDLE